MRRWMKVVLVAGLAATGLSIAVFLATYGISGVNIVLRREAHVWVGAKADDSRISPSMRLALQAQPPAATAGPFAWQTLDRGFDVAELPVLAGENEVDRILLSRIDPAHFTFQVATRPSRDRDAMDWMQLLGAVLVINGSYFSRDGSPATPLLSARVLSGPADYDARHGAFVASASFVGIRDLARQHWREAFSGADHAMVSYPILIGADGRSRSKGDARWLANRSFVAQDSAGRIVLGTTKDAFFSLDRLAAFLLAAPLDLKLALNLDGGPIACQAIVLKHFRRDFCGAWEMAAEKDELKVLRPLFGRRRWALPIALAVVPKQRPESDQ
jgi:hypothetical protein